MYRYNVLPTQLVSPFQLETPGEALQRGNIRQAQALLGSETNLTRGLDLAGSLGMQIGQALVGQGLTKSSNLLNSQLASGSITQDTFNKKNNLLQGLGFLNNSLGSISGLSGMGIFALGYNGQNSTQGYAEGGEIVESPNGNYTELQGPSHENGGIPMSINNLSNIYSNRVKIDGVSIADRVKKRIVRNARLEDILYRDPHNTIVKKSWERSKNNTEKINKQELNLQSNIAKILQ